jgi:ABC-type Mn2+/Zn2+ transport system ATPase subunit
MAPGGSLSNTQSPTPVPLAPQYPNTPISLSIRGLGFSYNGHPALQNISLDVRQGEFVALMGRNGAGKTTLLKQLVGLLTPNQGRGANHRLHVAAAA